jgi:peptidoglycan/LPS O-acetylase OafA/YrhL
MTDAKPTNYFPALDGVRGLAIILVLLFHNFRFLAISEYGWMGVDLFFVISGFLITNILLKTVGKEHYFKNFYTRRVLRIFPLYYLTLIVFFTAFSLLKRPEGSSYYLQHHVWFWTLLENWLFSYQLPKNGLLIHYWSLAVEEQFYLVWPFVIYRMRKSKALLTLTVALVSALVLARLILAVLQQNGVIHHTYFILITYSRFDGILVGSALAIISLQRQLLKRWMSAILLVIAVVLNICYLAFVHLYKGNFAYFPTLGYTVIAVCFGILVYESTLARFRFVRILFDNLLFRFFGRVSYGLYLLHLPIYLLLFPLINQHVNNVLLTSILLTGIAILLSYVSYIYFEMYFLKQKRKFV